MPEMTGARFLAETLKGYGVSHVFFMPYMMPVAMHEFDKIGINRIMAHCEKGAAYMADGYARISRRPGVAMCQSVGAMNLAAGLQDAYLGCSPVIAITGREIEAHLHRWAYQEVDHIDPFNAVTKFNATVTQLENFPRYLRHAFRAATSGTPAPVHLDTINLGGETISRATADLEIVVEEQYSGIPPYRPTPEISYIREAIRLLTKARRPVIVAGGGVTVSGAGAELVELAEKLNVPVATSLNAKETFPAFHRLNVGCCGHYSRSCANKTVAGADLVFFIGSHTGGQVTFFWQIPRQGTRAIQLDINAEEIGRSYPAAVGLQGDAKATLRMMIDEAKAVTGGEHEQWAKQAQQFVTEWREGMAPHADSDRLPMRPERLCKELTNILPDDAVLVSDTGHSGIWTATMVDLKSPHQSYIRCAGSLGWGIPAAIGAKCAVPDRPVICFCGDGGIWYHLTELDTALRCGVNTVTVVNNNHSLNQEQGGVERAFGGRDKKSDSLWMLRDVDFAKIAESMGCFGIRVSKPAELTGALDQALSAGKPAVIDVVTDIEGIAPPPWC
ncbi:MAG: thiamine pyrophosphate-binding protein [Spirochaetales bacterium]|nr:thiamine pyrophosphate-binding protein [Spirochaetales bacterium]